MLPWNITELNANTQHKLWVIIIELCRFLSHFSVVKHTCSSSFKPFWRLGAARKLQPAADLIRSRRYSNLFSLCIHSKRSPWAHACGEFCLAAEHCGLFLCLDVMLASPVSQFSSREKQEERASSSSSLSSVTLFSPCLSGSSSARPGKRGESQPLAGTGSACPSWYCGPKRGTRTNISCNTQFRLVSLTASRCLMSVRQREHCTPSWPTE